MQDPAQERRGSGNPWFDAITEPQVSSRKFGEWEKRDIVEVIQEHGIQLEEVGNGAFKCCCPFHSERNPSFFVAPEVQRCWCWSCWPEGGDVISFVQKVRDCSFEAALEFATVIIDGPDAIMRRMLREVELEQSITILDQRQVVETMRRLRRTEGDSAAFDFYMRFLRCQTRQELANLL